MNDVPFSEPITLKLQSVGQRKVASSWEAIECMQQWPDRAPGRNWRAAYRACRDALDGWRTAREAHCLRQGGAHRGSAGHGTLIHLNINPPERQ
ncbi:DUF982 domain-containing protein [Mesorhizobium sp.]|uniref:DUF982 domain-containing protein n=1 Tax=Mesorhizobium sp. TaxID=1871066 RepID=UPI00257AED80|nr:DUF982 domain-containing protein [Mesorhizobium sp.]